MNIVSSAAIGAASLKSRLAALLAPSTTALVAGCVYFAALAIALVAGWEPMGSVLLGGYLAPVLLQALIILGRVVAIRERATLRTA